MIDVPPHLEDRWRELDPTSRAYVDDYLGLARGPGADAIVATGTRLGVAAAPTLPPAFAEDLVGGAHALRAAFPVLRRTLVGIRYTGARVVVRIVCEGVHAEPFFGILRATQRPVRFVEEHRLHAEGGRLCAARVSIDVRSIIRQLRAS